ncbi:MAG: hypothetical protein D6706_12085, partial [Chloroflexi bacterium]
ATPTGLQAVSDSRQVTLSWSQVPGATYELFWSTAPNVTTASSKIPVGAATSYTHTGLTNGTTYYYAVRAMKNGGVSALSSITSAVPYLQTPSILNLVPRSGQIQVRWTPITGATYELFWSTAPNVTTASTKISIGPYPYYWHNGLTNGTTYYYAVRAVKNGAVSALSPIRSAVPQVPVVSGLSAAPGKAQTILLKWNPVAGATYELFWSRSPNVTTASSKIVLGQVSSFSHTPPKVGVIYYYALRTVMNGLVGSLSNIVSARAIPVNVTTLAGGNGIGLLDGPAATAKFNFPRGIAIDASGNVYIADAGNHAIRKYDPVTKTVSTLAGGNGCGFRDGQGTAAQFCSPSGIAVDASGKVYVADTNNNAIRIYDPVLHLVTTWAGPTFGTVIAQFGHPFGVSIGPDYLYVADTNNHSIRTINYMTNNVFTVAGGNGPGYLNGSASFARFNAPKRVVCDNAAAPIVYYVVDTGNHAIRKYDPVSGTVSTLAGGNGWGFLNGSGMTAQFHYPSDIAIDASGNIYVVDTNNHAIRKIQ